MMHGCRQMIGHFPYSSNQLMCTVRTHSESQGTKWECVCSSVCKHTVLMCLIYSSLMLEHYSLSYPSLAFFKPTTSSSPMIKGKENSVEVQNYSKVSLTAGFFHVRNTEKYRNRNDKEILPVYWWQPSRNTYSFSNNAFPLPFLLQRVKQKGN